QVALHVLRQALAQQAPVRAAVGGDDADASVAVPTVDADARHIREPQVTIEAFAFSDGAVEQAVVAQFGYAQGQRLQERLARLRRPRRGEGLQGVGEGTAVRGREGKQLD